MEKIYLKSDQFNRIEAYLRSIAHFNAVMRSASDRICEDAKGEYVYADDLQDSVDIWCDDCDPIDIRAI